VLIDDTTGHRWLANTTKCDVQRCLGVLTFSILCGFLSPGTSNAPYAFCQAPDSTTLKSASKGLFEIGVGTSLRAMTASEASLALVKREFGYLTPENCMKPQAVQPTRGKMDFSKADAFMDFANSHDLKVVGHCLVWAKDDRTPPWFFESQTAESGKASEKELRTRMERYMQTVIGRYRKHIDHWDVVNEALDDGPDVWRPSGWQTAFGGPDFIGEAFRIAQAADPNSLLVYNDYHCDLPRKRPDMLTLAKLLLSQDAPVHAIGLQGHFEFGEVPYEEIETTFEEIRRLGLKVVISEVDIDVVKRGKWWADDGKHREELKSFDPYKDGLTPELESELAAQYGKLFEVYARNADVVERVTLWGLHDGANWLNHFPWERNDYTVRPGLAPKRRMTARSRINKRDLALSSDSRSPNRDVV